MLDVEQHKTFQATELETIAECSSEVRDRIVEKLNRRLSVCALFDQSPE